MNSIYYICKNRVNLFQDGTKPTLKIGIEEESKSSRRYVSARFASTWFYNQLQIRRLLNALPETLVNARLADEYAFLSFSIKYYSLWQSLCQSE